MLYNAGGHFEWQEKKPTVFLLTKPAGVSQSTVAGISLNLARTHTTYLVNVELAMQLLEVLQARYNALSFCHVSNERI